MVLYEIYIGTKKFLEKPVATTSYTADSELPMVSLCQFRKSHFMIGFIVPHNMTYDLYREGNFYSDHRDPNVSAEEVFEKSFDDNYYLLDITGRNITITWDLETKSITR